MLLFAVALFLLAALFGLAILISLLEGKPSHKIVVFLHGSFALFAIGMMIGYLIIYGGDRLLFISLILFIGAACGGLTLFTLDMQKKHVPKWLGVVHPLVAMAGLVTLIIRVLP